VTDVPRFDPGALEMLRRVGRQHLVEKMAEMFAANAPRKLAAARAALSPIDENDFARAMHSLKSSAGQLGARRLQEICSKLEATAPSDGASNSTLRMLDEAEIEMREAIDWINRGVTAGRESS